MKISLANFKAQQPVPDKDSEAVEPIQNEAPNSGNAEADNSEIKAETSAQVEAPALDQPESQVSLFSETDQSIDQSALN